MAYTTTSNKLKITELDFDNIKTALKTYLKGQDEFKDYDFEGSALNILLDILAYNTHYNGFYTNMLASEMFMDSASLRSSVVSLAKHLGYTPASRSGAFTNVDITFTDVADSPTNVLISRATKFVSKINNQGYTFLNPSAAIATLQDDGTTYKATNVEIREGVYFTNSYVVAGLENELFEIPSEIVDISTLVVTLGGEIYQKVDEITEIKSDTKVYFLQEGRNGYYEIYFGDGIIGKAPSIDDVVEIAYFGSFLGVEGNGAKVFSAAQVIQNANYTVTVSLSEGYTRSSGGAERETAHSIRTQSPKQYGMQKRTVTAEDYRTRLLNSYDFVDAVRVWGGEENIPPDPGTVYVSVKPKTGYVLSDAERKYITNTILKSRNVVTITPKVVDPDYMFLILDCVISHDPRRTAKTTDQIETVVRETIKNYSVVYLDTFDEYFRNSLVTSQIDNSDVSITNSLVDVQIAKRIKTTIGDVRTFNVLFNNEIYHPHTGHESVLSSTTFSMFGVDGCTLYDKDGRVCVGKNGGLVRDVGSIDYSTGEVILNNVRFDGPESIIEITIRPKFNNVSPPPGSILTIDPFDIGITMVDDTETIQSKSVQGY